VIRWNENTIPWIVRAAPEQNGHNGYFRWSRLAIAAGRAVGVEGTDFFGSPPKIVKKTLQTPVALEAPHPRAVDGLGGHTP
jgi:hypothetical protein